MSEAIPYPQWTTPRRQSSGTDHLGYRRPCITLYGNLVPLLTNQTNSIRYYSFYAWLLACFQDRIKKQHADSDTDIEVSKLKKEWDAFLRAGEMLIALSNRGNRGVVGSDWVKRLDKKEIVFAQERHFQNTGLDQYYKGVLRKLGVMDDSEGVPVLSQEPDSLGQKLAQSFGQNDVLSQRFIEHIEAGHLDIDEVKDDEMERFSLRHLHAAEKELLVSVLFESVAEPRQRATLIALIYVLEHIENKAEFKNLENQFSWLMYANRDQAGATLVLPKQGLDNIQQLWALYHFGELYHIAMEGLLKHVLLAIPYGERGRPVSEVINTIVCTDTAEDSVFELSWEEFSLAYPLVENPYGNEQFSEKTLSRKDAIQDIAILLVQLEKRFLLDTSHMQNFMQHIAQHKEESIVDFIAFAARHKALGMREFLAKLILKKVIERHLLVAMEKLKRGADTFLFQLRSNHLIHPKTFGVEYTNPRIVNCYRALQDLGIVDGTLTEYGRKTIWPEGTDENC